MRSKRYFYLVLHLLFLSGLIYAFNQFITTPKINLYERRLWAYENWIIISFYALFLYLTLTEREIRLKAVSKNFLVHFSEFKRILLVNLLLLVFPWGLFLILTPGDLLSMFKINSVYWRTLGFFSLLGAALYYLPYVFYQKGISYYIFVFGMIDNLLAGLVVTFLFLIGKVTLIAWSVVPLLFYFAAFFYEQAKKHPRFLEKNQGLGR